MRLHVDTEPTPHDPAFQLPSRAVVTAMWIISCGENLLSPYMMLPASI